MLRRLLYTLIILGSVSTWAGTSESKKNLCTITINSNDEAELFKSYLDPAGWNFIELAPDGSGESAPKTWFADACKKNIRCDVLVISGHFGGTFFGSSKLTLSMEELEKNSCDKSCDGILKQPREVFLFGCNTLASKEKDHRSPEEYMQVLLDDGFSTTQASQIVSFRYSGFGDSFQHSMSQVFATTPRIYGFSSVGPSGKKVAPLLNTYLQTTKAEYQDFDSYVRKSGAASNLKLATALKRTSFKQAQGLLPAMKSSDEKPYCYIRSSEKSNIEKLNYIKNLFNSNGAIKILSHIQGFLHELKLNSVNHSKEEATVLAEFSRDEKLKSSLLQLLKLEGDIYLPLKANILNTLKDLELVTENFVADTFNNLVDLRSTFTPTRRSMLCSIQMNINLPATAIVDERWSELEFITAMICMRPQDLEIQKRMAQVVATSKDGVLRASALWYFYSVNATDERVQEVLAIAMRSDPESYVRQSAAMVLRQLRPKTTKVIAIMLEALAKESDSNVRIQIENAVRAL